MLVAIGHSFWGQYLNLYLASTVFDKILHVIGTYALTILVYSLMVSGIGNINISRISLFILIESLKSHVKAIKITGIC